LYLTEQQFNLGIRGVELSGKGQLYRRAPANLDASIIAGQKPGVEVEEQALDALPNNASIAPFSVSIYKLAIK
jgi:hypothetical protein